MAKLLRKVKQNRWFRADVQHLLDVGDVPADAIGDLSTSQNSLSVYRVEGEIAEVERVARALASGANHLDNVGYVLFDEALLAKASIEMATTNGGTVDSVVNKWHVDLTNLTGKKLVALTTLIFLEGESGIILKKRIIELVREGLNSKELPEKVQKLL